MPLLDPQKQTGQSESLEEKPKLYYESNLWAQLEILHLVTLSTPAHGKHESLSLKV